MYVTPVGEDLRACLYHIVRDFDLQFFELPLSQIAHSNTPLDQVFTDVFNLYLNATEKQGCLLYLPELDVISSILQDPHVQHLFLNSLTESGECPNPIIVFAETHGVSQVPESVRVQFDFLEIVPPLAREETISFCKELVKFNLPWDDQTLTRRVHLG